MQGGWDSKIVNGQTTLTMAGWWNHWVGKTLFRLLVLRWLWRFAMWGWLLFLTSRMRLQLIAFHPDQCGGLGFLSVYPTVFLSEIFALSSVVAAQLVNQVYDASVSVDLLLPMVLGWIGLVLLMAVGPLAVFALPLFRLWEESIISLGRLAGEHHTAFQQKWMQNQGNGADLLGSEDVSSAADIGPVAASPYSLRFLPITLSTLIGVACAAGAPMLAVVVTQMPLLELLRRITGVFL